MRIVFFGTPEFACPTLQSLLGSRHVVAAAVTQPDRPRGRGQRTTAGPVKVLALEAGVPVIQPDSLKGDAVLAVIRGYAADLGVVAAYGRLLPEALLAIPPRGMINVHASLLPRYRGAAPVHRAVIAGERETGVTIMRVVKKLDAGPMLSTVSRPIGADDTSLEVERDLARLGAALLVDTVDRLEAGVVNETAQDEAAATYAPRLVREDGAIDWSQPAERIHNLVRGLHPWPHAFTFTADKARLIVIRSAFGAEPSGAEPGTIVAARNGTLSVAAGAGIVHLLQLQLEGKRAMSARELLAGHPLLEGSRLSASQ